MDIDKVYNLFFSPTDTTKFVLQFLSEQISPNYKNINLTSRDTNLDDVSLAENDLVFLGVPSYAGRVPITFKERFSKIKGNNALAIVVVTYGNRAQEDTLIELFDMAKEQGFRILAGSAVVTEHSIIHDFGKGRPDRKDKAELISFMQKLKNKLQEDVLLPRPWARATRSAPPYTRRSQGRGSSGTPPRCPQTAHPPPHSGWSGRCSRSTPAKKVPGERCTAHPASAHSGWRGWRTPYPADHPATAPASRSRWLPAPARRTVPHRPDSRPRW